MNERGEQQSTQAKMKNKRDHDDVVPREDEHPNKKKSTRWKQEEKVLLLEMRYEDELQGRMWDTTVARYNQRATELGWLVREMDSCQRTIREIRVQEAHNKGQDTHEAGEDVRYWTIPMKECLAKVIKAQPRRPTSIEE